MLRQNIVQAWHQQLGEIRHQAESCVASWTQDLARQQLGKRGVTNEQIRERKEKIAEEEATKIRVEGLLTKTDAELWEYLWNYVVDGVDVAMAKKATEIVVEPLLPEQERGWAETYWTDGMLETPEREYIFTQLMENHIIPKYGNQIKLTMILPPSGCYHCKYVDEENLSSNHVMGYCHGRYGCIRFEWLSLQES